MTARCRHSFSLDRLGFDLWPRLQITVKSVCRAKTMWEFEVGRFTPADCKLLISFPNSFLFHHVQHCWTLFPVLVCFNLFSHFGPFLCFLHQLVVFFVEVLFFCSRAAQFHRTTHFNCDTVSSANKMWSQIYCFSIFVGWDYKVVLFIHVHPSFRRILFHCWLSVFCNLGFVESKIFQVTYWLSWNSLKATTWAVLNINERAQWHIDFVIKMNVFHLNYCRIFFLSSPLSRSAAAVTLP